MKDRPKVDAVCRDFRTAPISEMEKALFAYLSKVNDAPGSIRAQDLEPVKAAGWSDAALYDAVTVCAMFNFFNRWIDGTGVEDIPKGFYEAKLEQFGDRGYAP